jgi:hypothetical protein
MKESGAAPTQSSSAIDISADGRFVLYSAPGSTFFTTTSDTNGTDDLMVTDMNNSTMKAVSITSSGTTGNGRSLIGRFNGNNQIAFESAAYNLTSGYSDSRYDIFSAGFGITNTCIIQ